MDKQQAARMSVVSAVGLILLKLTAGLVTLSISILSDALHSVMDLLSALVSNYSIRRSVTPPDVAHLYGHGKYENLSGVVEAVLILIAAGVVVYESIVKIMERTGVEQIDLGIAVMIVSMAVNIFVSRRMASVAVKEDSIALKVDATQRSTDIITSFGVLAALVLIRLTGQPVLDPVVAILLSALIVRSALILVRETTQDLLDQSLPPEEEAIILDALKEHTPHLTRFHALRTRKSGPFRFIDLHLQVDGSMTVQEADALSDHLEAVIKSRLPRTSITVRLEPIAGGIEDPGEDSA
jgi:cation diffusion facilitator family transporter